MIKLPRTCLVNPPHPYLTQPTAQAPLGLLYVASALYERGFPVQFADLSDRHFKDEYFSLPNADVYGVTGTVLDRRAVNAVARFVKQRVPGCRVVVGGPIAMSAEHLDRSAVDAVVRGEGEDAIFNVLRDYPRLHREYVGARIEDLDARPWPARHLLPGALGGGVFVGHKEYFKGGSTVFVTSRGCPFDCAFCASPGIWKRKIMYRSVDAVVDEIRYVVKRHDVRQFRFSDDNVTANRDRVVELCRRLKPMEIAWRASIRVYPRDPEMFEAMREGGCTEVCFGIESADDTVLHTLNKKATVKDNREAIRNAHAAGLAVRVLMMAGTPGETRDTAQRNIDFLEDLKDEYDSVSVTNFVPLPGTAVARDPEKYGVEILDDDIDKFNLVMYGPEGPNAWPNLVRPVGLGLEELTECKRRIREYVEQCGKGNKG